MIIAIVGTPSAGKTTVLEYLVEKHGFLRIGLEQPSDIAEGTRLVSLRSQIMAIGACAMTQRPRRATELIDLDV